MSISEFKNRVNLIVSFAVRMQEETVPYDIRKTMLKVYATTLQINLTDPMVDSITESTAICA